MKKSQIRILFYILIVALIATQAFLIYQKIEHQKNIENEIIRMRDLPLKYINGSKYVHDNNKKVVIILFNSECDHCQSELKDIRNHVEAFRAVDVLLVSTESLNEIKSFAMQSGLHTYPNFHFANISSENLHTTFGVVLFPHMYIYNTDKSLLKEFKGETKVDAIIKYIK